MQGYMHMSACLRKPGVDMVFLDHYPPHLFKQGQSLNPGFTDWLDGTAKVVKASVQFLPSLMKMGASGNLMGLEVT